MYEVNDRDTLAPSKHVGNSLAYVKLQNDSLHRTQHQRNCLSSPLMQRLKRCVNGKIAASHVDTAVKTAIEQRNTVLFPKIMNVQDRYGLYIHIYRR